MFANNLKIILKNSLNIPSTSQRITTKNLLISLIENKNSLGAKILKEQGVKIRRPFAPKKTQNSNVSSLYKKALIKSAKIAYQYKNQFIGSEHLLYALLSLKKCKACKILSKLLNLQDLRKNTLALIQNNAQEFNRYSKIFENLTHKNLKTKKRKEQKTPQNKKNALDLFCFDLTEKSKKQETDPLIGRKKEMERLINILMRRHKNNPILIGLPGVGKTALVYGLAQKIARKEVPVFLLDKKIFSLDLASLVAGTIFRGEFEARLQKIIEETENNSNVILFIDEIHNIIGAGSASGSLDTANILKAPLMRGSFQCIGATTLEEYQKHLEKDKALERRFQKIFINEPSPDEAVKILQGTKKEYEKFHQIKIPNKAIKFAVELSHRFINDRFLPDKALDLMDEALANLKNKINLPNNYKKIKEIEERLKNLTLEKLKAVRKENFILAVKIKREEKNLQKKLNQSKTTMEKAKEVSYGILKTKDLERTLENTTSIPIHLLKKEKESLLNLEKNLSKKIIGQNKIIKNIAASIRKAKAGLACENKPLASFLFLGQTGVGKTEMAKVLAKEIFGDEKNLVRLDMSEFKESFASSRLIGAPAGYVGYEEGGFLTEKIRHQPYSLILLDEIEKAHPQILNLLLQILEEGSLNDHKGHAVNFKNTIIIMTSNLGTEKLIKKDEKLGFMDKTIKEDDQKEIKTKILESLKEFLRPELVNRIDKVLIFHSLTLKNLEKIAQIEIEKLSQKLKPKKIVLKISPGLFHFLAKKSAKENLGARPLKRLISNLIEDEIAKIMLSGKIQSNKEIKVKLNQKKKISIE